MKWWEIAALGLALDNQKPYRKQKNHVPDNAIMSMVSPKRT